MILGDKSKFAIEYEITKKYCQQNHRYLFGKTRVYIEGFKFGNWNEENLIGVLVVQLKAIIKSNENINSFLIDATDDVLKELSEDRDNYEKTGLNHAFYAENFDDYYSAYYKQNKSITFIWRYVDNPISKYEDYSREIFIGRVDAFYFEKIVQEFDTVFCTELETVRC